MSFWNVLSLFSGLALFLYAMIEMNRHMTAIAGRRMKSFLLQLTKGPFRGYLTGLGITVLNQSSSATTVLEAALVGSGFMTFQQSLTVTLGAELGATMFPQLVAIPGLTRFSALFLCLGLVISFSAKRKKYNHIGLTVFSFGLMFLGLEIMSLALIPLREFKPFIDLMQNVEEPILGILIGLFFTMLIQSSGATAGITIAMALSGTISLEQAVPINMGAAVGTCITAVLGSLTLNWEAKRSAFIHIMFQLLGITWVFFLLSFYFRGERFYIWWIKWFCLNVLNTESLARQIAMGFTFIPIINHLILFPNLSLVVKIFNRMFPEREKPVPFTVQYLDDSLITRSVGLSLEMTLKEIIRVTDILSEMIETMRQSFHSSDSFQKKHVSALDSKVDLLHGAIITFLAKLSQEELSAWQSMICMDYMRIQNELESIGDVIDKNIMVLLDKKIEKKMIFSEDGFHELDHLIYKIGKNFENLTLALKKDNSRSHYVKLILEDYKKKEEEKYKQFHIDRLQKGLTETIATSAVHLDLITYFTRINSHIVYIARRLIHSEK